MIAISELEGAHGFQFPLRDLCNCHTVCDLGEGKEILQNQSCNKREVFSFGSNIFEPGVENQNRKSTTGEIKVSDLSYKHAKQSDPRLAWLMFHNKFQMYCGVKERERVNNEKRL